MCAQAAGAHLKELRRGRRSMCSESPGQTPRTKHWHQFFVSCSDATYLFAVLSVILNKRISVPGVFKACLLSGNHTQHTDMQLQMKLRLKLYNYHCCYVQ